MSADAVKLDDRDWHIEDAVAQNLHIDQETEAGAAAAFAHAGAHMALYLRWGLGPGLGPRIAAYEAGEAGEAGGAGGMTGTRFMEEIADWTLYSDVSVPEIQAFSEVCYGVFRGLYAHDVGRAVKGDYGWREEEADFSTFAAMVDGRLGVYRSAGDAAVQRPGVLGRLLGGEGPAPAGWRPRR